jgi:hypothetical protein
MLYRNNLDLSDLSLEVGTERLDFVSIQNNFHHRILCLMTSLSLIDKGFYLEMHDFKSRLYAWAKKNNRITQEVIDEKKEIRNVSFSLSEDESKALNSQEDLIQRAGRMARRNTLISLISEFDNLIADLIRLGHKTRPQILKKSSKTFTCEQIFSFPDSDNLFEHLIEKEIDAILRASHSQQIDYLEKEFSLGNLKNIPHWDKFIEVTERRNIFIHCDGKVSSQYLDICRKNKVPLPDDCNLGSLLDVDANYLVKSYLAFVTISSVLTQKIWRKLKPEDSSSADAIISQSCFTLIKLENHDSAIELLEFIESNLADKSTPFATRLAWRLNKAQAYKWKGEKSKMESILKEIDFSACQDDFKLAGLVLTDKFVEAACLVRHIGSRSSYVNEIAYREWPIFREFRKSSEFLDAFKEVFGKEFNPTTEEHLVIEDSSLMEERDKAKEKE